MWIFGYGSLMFDGWESSKGCIRREWAELAGYRRIFNKQSVKNWGTREQPGLTLNLQKFDSGTSRGVAFAFPDNTEVTQTVLDYLGNREACGPCILPILILGGQTAQAHVYIYHGRNILNSLVGLTQRAAMVVNATGTSGACFDYVRKTFDDLANIGIEDAEVTLLWNAVCELKSK